MTKPIVTDEMVRRFLAWPLPASFNPDCGISFKRIYNEDSPCGPAEHEPTGTNLLDAMQARAMLEHVLALAPATRGAVPAGWKLVPIEPTLEMVSAFQEGMRREFGMKTTAGYHGRIYRAMLDAAPAAPQSDAAQPASKVAVCQRIMDLVDQYHEHPHRNTRYAIRAALMDEWGAQPASISARAVGGVRAIEYSNPWAGVKLLRYPTEVAPTGEWVKTELVAALAAPSTGQDAAQAVDAAREVVRIWDERGYPNDSSLSLALNRLSAALAAQGNGGTTA